MKITHTPEGGNFFEPENQGDSDVLRALISMGALKEAAPPPALPEVKEFDFLTAFFPKDPSGAKKYFEAELHINGQKESINRQEQQSS